MSFKSEAQRAKFAQLVKEGKMSQAMFDEFQTATGDTKLPERAKKPAKSTGIIRKVRKTR